MAFSGAAVAGAHEAPAARAPHAAAASHSSKTRAVTLGSTTGAPITVASDPVGLSVEYPVLAGDLGTGACPPPALVSAIEALGAPTIRIGGDSGDQTAPAGTPPFTGVNDLPTDFWTQLACLESQTHEPFVVGLNLAAQMPAWAATMAAGARGAVPANLLSFEIGNEADIDGPSVPWWNATADAHTLIPFTTYLDDAQAVDQQLGAGADVEGPDFATPRWIANIPQIASALSLKTVDTHFYPLNACTGAAQATVNNLLLPGASELSTAVQETLAQATQLHLPMVISESNSVACRGKAGVSDSPGTAVWGLRLVINAIRSGIGSVRFHSSGSTYDPFIVTGTTVTTRPLYDGLEAAVQLLPIGATVATLKTPLTLMGVVVTRATGPKTYIVTSYESKPQSVTLSSTQPASVIRISAANPIVADTSAKPKGGKLTIVVEPNSVVAFTPGG